MTFRQWLPVLFLGLFLVSCTEDSTQPSLDTIGGFDSTVDTDGTGDGSGVTNEVIGPAFGGEVGFKVITQGQPVTRNEVWGVDKGFGDFDLFVAGTLGTVSVFSQSRQAWEDISLDSSASVNGIWAESRNFVVICGDDGLLKRYADLTNVGDLHWYDDDAATGVSEKLNDVHGSSRDNLWAVGDAGTILHLVGDVWAKIDPSVAGLQGDPLPNLNAVFVEESGKVHIGGDGVYLVIEGETMTPNTEAFAGFELFDIDVASGVAWLAGNNHGIFEVHADGTLVEHAPTVYPASQFRGIWIAPQGQVLAAGYLAPPIVWTYNGNENDEWMSTSVQSPPAIKELYPDRVNPEGRLSDIWGVGLENYVVVTYSGQIIHYAAHP